MNDAELKVWLREQLVRQRQPSHLKKPCLVWTGSRDKDGYGRLAYNGKMLLSHRLRWYLEYGYWPKDCLLHHCDVPSCCRLSHLYEGSDRDNANDRIERLRTPRGEDNTRATLTDKEVIDMRRLRRNYGLSYRKIGDRFCVSRDAAHAACTGKTWGHLNHIEKPVELINKGHRRRV